jgi:F0F1-type ATP synthase assembly protein I
MQNSIAAGRRLAARVVAVQLGVTILLAGGFLLQGWQSGLAALSGGGAVVLGTALFALRSLSSQAVSANVALMRLIGGVALKWTAFLAVFYVALVTFSLPAIPLLTGTIVTILAFLFAASLKT